MLNEGAQAPDFSLQNEKEEYISLARFKGRKVVLYFYPKDDTPGCTKEACAFRDAYDDFLEKGAVVIGVSNDDVKSHRKFKDKYDLPFYLLADPEHEVIEQYGAWVEKSMYGKKYMGTQRSTYVLDEEGKIIKVFPKVKPADHAAEVLALL